MKNKFLLEMQSRGYLNQCTDLDKLDETSNKKSITGYIGFDCTASSLHVGSLLQIMILRLMQKHGHRPIVLFGDGTTLIGDPSGKDDTRKILGSPSTQSSFDNDVWIYIERKTTVSNVSSLGKKKLLVNNVLVLEFDQRGLLLKKDFYNKNQMNNIKIVQNETKVLNKKNSFIKNVLFSLRQKINDPLGQRSAR